MAQKTDAELTTQAEVIRDETTALANTKTRVYNNLKDIIDSKVNNDNLQTALNAKQALVNSATVLTDGATIDLTAIKHTLTTSSSRTFTISYTGDDITIEITLSATSATQTFPSGSLCVTEGAASGDNTCPMSGVSGDKYIIAIKKIGSVYYVVCKNFGQ